jgi:hypothetical protein
MNAKPTLAAALLGLAASVAFAAPARPLMVVDHSTVSLIDKADVQALVKEHLGDEVFNKRLAKIMPARRWAFLTQVEGGFNDAKICVVTARVAMVPRAGKKLTFAPEKMATSFDALPGVTQAQCKELAKAKLAESAKAVRSSLMTN